MTKWESRLADAGCRITAPRQAVMRVLVNATCPLEPKQILERAQATHQALGLVTVYRTLNLLSELHLVRRVHRDDGCHGYLPASPGHRHVLICQGCARAVEFPGGDDIYDLIERVEANTGYRVQEHLLQLLGLCPECQQTRKE
jgi:Fur family ferric uptake transcriptional regulator